MEWLIEVDRFDEGYMKSVITELQRMGVKYHIVKYIPISNGYVVYEGQKKHVSDVMALSNGPLLAYGSINLMQKISPYKWCRPGPGVTWDNYKCSNYYPYYSEYLFNNFGDWYPLQWLAKKFDDLVPYEAFIRPDDSTKSFKGGRYTKETFLEAIENIDENIWVYVDTVPNEECLLEEEYRLFCINGKVITGSQYRQREKKNTSPEVPTDAVEYVESMIQSVGYMPDDVFAVDIVKSDRQYYLLELSPWACAGFYDCDIPKLVTEIHKYYTDLGRPQ
jgi:hypothetical protein